MCVINIYAGCWLQSGRGWQSVHLVISGRQIGRPRVGIWRRCVQLARWLARKFAAQHAMTSVHQDKPRHSTDLVELRSPILWSAFMPFVATFMPLWNIFDHLIVAPPKCCIPSSTAEDSRDTLSQVNDRNQRAPAGEPLGPVHDVI